MVVGDRDTGGIHDKSGAATSSVIHGSHLRVGEGALRLDLDRGFLDIFDTADQACRFSRLGDGGQPPEAPSAPGWGPVLGSHREYRL